MSRNPASIAAVVALLMFLSCASAGMVNVTEPVNTTMQSNQTVYLGKVGPGQTFYINISAATTNAAGVYYDHGWNQLVVTGLPQGWLAANSALYGQYLSAKITAAPDAQDGIYTFNLTAVNIGNYSKLGNTSFAAQINVTPDVFKLSVSPTNVSTGPGQPASISVGINNTGVSDSPFLISVQGLPGWNITKEVIALHHTSEVFSYPIYADEPGIYDARFNVTSTSSALVSKKSNVTLVVQASVPNDYKAIGQGSLASPIIYEPIYAIMYIISKLFGG